MTATTEDRRERMERAMPRPEAKEDIDAFLERVDALEKEIRALREGFEWRPNAYHSLSEGMIEASFSNMLRNFSTIRTEADALKSTLALRRRAQQQRAAKAAAE